MKRKPTNRSTAVYDFDESDDEPFTAKRKKFFDVFSKGKECSKGRGKNDGSMCEDRTQKPTKSMHCGKVIAKETSANLSLYANDVVWGKNNCKDLTQSPTKSMHYGKVIAKETNVDMSSPASDMIETDDSDSESNQARRQLDMRFAGAPGVSSAGVFKDEDTMAEEGRKVVMHGKELWLFEEKYSFPEYSFTADAIELKTQAFGAFKMPLLEIKAFRSGSHETGLPVIELDLRKHGVRSLQEHLGRPDNYNSCHTISSTFLDHSSYVEKIRQITSLSDGYKSIYRHGKYVRCHTENSVNGIHKDRDNSEIKEIERSLNDCIAHRSRASSNDWSDLIYPTEDDRDAVTVTRYDYSLLEPDQFLSDTIIDFYIKYLESKISEADKKRFYFYNSFFFRKLTEVDKHLQTSLEKSKSSFERMKRWTAGINIFDKNYLFIPIMQNAHWSLVVICHPGYLSAACSDEIDFKAPTILHLDSLEGCHTCVEEPIRSYLMEAWRERNNHNEDSESLCTLKFVTLKVPQQTNYSDCGLFLLHYVELFIAEVLTKDSTKFFDSYEWFNPADASRKRAHIQSLVQDLKANKSARDHVRPQHLTDTYVMRSSDISQRSMSFRHDVCDVNRTTDILPEDSRIMQSHEYVSLDDSLECTILDVNVEDFHAHLCEANDPPAECTAKLVHGSVKFNAVQESFASATSDSFVTSSADAKSGVAFCCHYDDERIADRRASPVRKFSLDDILSGQVFYERSTSNGSLATKAGKLLEESNAAIGGIKAGTRAAVEDFKDGLADSVGVAGVWTEGKEAVSIDCKAVQSADKSCEAAGVGDISTEGAKVQPIDEVAAANTSSEGIFLQMKNGTVQPTTFVDGISRSMSRSIGCQVSKESSAMNDAGSDPSHYISSNRRLMSTAAKGTADGKSERASQRSKQCELGPMVKRITRSVSKEKV